MRKTIIWAALAAAVLAPFAGAEDKPAPRLKLIFAERFRFEAWDNAVSLDDAANDANAYTRNRTTLGLSWMPLKNLEVLGTLLPPPDQAAEQPGATPEPLRSTVPNRA